MNDYLDLARQGKNDWWRFVLGVLFILFCFIGLGALPILVMNAVVELDNNPATYLIAAGFAGIDPTLNFIVVVSSFVPFFLATPLAVRLIHARPMRTLVTPRDHIRWPRLFTGFGLWFVLAALISVVESLLYPGRYELTLDLTKLIPFALAALVLTPIQTSAEEFLFRGYVLQSAGLKVRNPFVLSALSGILFALPHMGNPEVSVNFWLLMLFYFSFGAFGAFISLKDNGLELALGIHAANNIFTAVFANYTISAIPSPAMFTINELDAVYGLIAPLVAFAVFYLIVFNPFKSQEQA